MHAPEMHQQSSNAMTGSSRRWLLGRAVSVVGSGMLVSSLPLVRSLERAAAQDKTVTLTARGAEVSASPGAAVARSAAAEAAAARGAARVRAAASFASAESGGMVVAQGAAAAAAADPAQGAVAQGALAAATASNQPPGAPLSDGGTRTAAPRPGLVLRRVPAARGGTGRAGARRIRGGRIAAGDRGRGARGERAPRGRGGRERVGRTPRAGVGIPPVNQPPALFAAMSTAAGIVAVLLRQRTFPGSLSAAVAARAGSVAQSG